MAELLHKSSIKGNQHLTVLSGMWAEFIRLDLAIENMTGIKKKLKFSVVIKSNNNNINLYLYLIVLDNGVLLNAATSFLDASPIYNSVSCIGTSAKIMKSESGHLKLIKCTKFVNINDIF